MGLTVIVLIIILLIAAFAIRSNLSVGKKILIIVAFVIIIFAALAYVFITGFDRGMDPRREEINNTIK